MYLCISLSSIIYLSIGLYAEKLCYLNVKLHIEIYCFTYHFNFIYIQIYIHIDIDIYIYNKFRLSSSLQQPYVYEYNTKFLNQFLILWKNWHLSFSPPIKVPPLLLEKIIKIWKSKLCLA